MFEKVSAFIFLILIIGMLGFFTFVKVPQDSKQIILVIIGVLMGEASKALPRLFGSDESEKKELIGRIERLEEELKVAQSKYETLEKNHSRLLETLISHHVIYDDVTSNRGV